MSRKTRLGSALRRGGTTGIAERGPRFAKMEGAPFAWKDLFSDRAGNLHAQRPTRVLESKGAPGRRFAFLSRRECIDELAIAEKLP